MDKTAPPGWPRLDRCREFSQDSRRCQLYATHDGPHACGWLEAPREYFSATGPPPLHVMRWDDAAEWQTDDDSGLTWCLEPAKRDVFGWTSEKGRCRSISPGGRRCQLGESHVGAHADLYRRPRERGQTGRGISPLHLTRWDEVAMWPDDDVQTDDLRWAAMLRD
jgi:hypothetical protein